MWGRHGRTRTGEGSLLAWLGLLLMLGSFIWLQLIAVPRTVTRIEFESPPNPRFAIVVLDPGHGCLARILAPDVDGAVERGEPKPGCGDPGNSRRADAIDKSRNTAAAIVRDRECASPRGSGGRRVPHQQRRCR